MDYFLESTFTYDNTIIEKAAIARLGIFAKLGRPAQVQLLAYAPHWVGVVPAKSRKRVQGLFDYWQQATVTQFNLIGLRKLDEQLGFYRRDAITTREYHYSDGNRLIAKVQLAPDNQIDTVTFVGLNEQKLEVDTYDTRGFLSRRQFWYGGRVTHEEYLSPAGAVKIELLYGASGDVQVIRLPEVNRSFTSLGAWQADYLRTLLPAAVMISDRRELDALLPAADAGTRLLRVYHQLPKSESTARWVVRRPLSAYPQAYVLDEYSSGHDLVSEWATLLKEL